MSDQNKELANKLLNAHVAFFMSRIEGEGLEKTIEREVAEVFKWGKSVSLNDIVNREVLFDTILRSVTSAPFTDPLRNIVVTSTLTVIQSELNDGTNLQALVPKSEYDKTITHYATFEKLRADVIRTILESPIYSELISDVMYHGIKDYIMTENIVAKKVPGISALMKAGAKGLNKAMPKLEAAAEGTIKKFIATNLRNTVELSEKILNNALSGNNIESIADHFWDTISEKEFSKFKSYVTDEDIDRSVELGNELWEEIRQSEYLQNMIRKVVEHIFEDHGDQPFAELLEEIGYSEEYILGEAKLILPGSLDVPALKEYIEQRVRANMEDFYSSDVFIQALA